MWVLAAFVDLELGDHLERELVLRQHPANGLMKNQLWLALEPRCRAAKEPRRRVRGSGPGTARGYRSFRANYGGSHVQSGLQQGSAVRRLSHNRRFRKPLINMGF